MIFCCPACGGALERRESALVCPKGHSFDVARQGYVHLLPVKQMHAKVPGDTKQMVDARRQFLALGHYDAFRDTLHRLVSAHLPQGGTVLDAGCGEGFYTAALAAAALEKNGRTAGIDISKFAVKAAAGRHKGHRFCGREPLSHPLRGGKRRRADRCLRADRARGVSPRPKARRRDDPRRARRAAPLRHERGAVRRAVRKRGARHRLRGLRIPRRRERAAGDHRGGRGRTSRRCFR